MMTVSSQTPFTNNASPDCALSISDCNDSLEQSTTTVAATSDCDKSKEITPLITEHI